MTTTTAYPPVLAHQRIQDEIVTLCGQLAKLKTLTANTPYSEAVNSLLEVTVDTLQTVIQDRNELNLQLLERVRATTGGENGQV